MSFKTLIVGAGMAGCSAALWLRDLSVPFRWIEASGHIGGVLKRVHAPIPNYAAVSAPNDGQDIIRHLDGHLSSFDLAPDEARVESLSRREATSGWTAVLESGQAQDFDAVLLCTGTKPRTLDAIDSSADSRVSFSSMKIRNQVAGQRVLIIGGGDGAFEGATELGNANAEVVIIHRSDDFRARPEFQERVADLESVEVRPHTELSTLKWDGETLSAELTGPASKNHESFDWCVVKIGVKPIVPDTADHVARESGYVKVDRWQETSLSRLFAAGDVCSPEFQSLSTAAAQAATAARRISDIRDSEVSL